jgi:hypothetical protein
MLIRRQADAVSPAGGQPGKVVFRMCSGSFAGTFLALFHSRITYIFDSF